MQIKDMLIFIIVFTSLIILFNISLFLISLIPSELLYNNCLSSSKTLLYEGILYRINPILATIDNETDALVINEIYSIDSQNPLESYLLVRKNYNYNTSTFLNDFDGKLKSYGDNLFDENGVPKKDSVYNTVKELDKFLNNQVFTSVNYSRYYHGYLIIYRPLMIIFDIMGIRIIQIVIFIMLLILLYKALSKNVKKHISAIFILVFTIFGYFYVAYSLQQGLVFIIMMISALIIVKHFQSYTLSKLCLHFFIIAMLTNFFDFLTNPILTWTIPMFCYYLCLNNNEKPIKSKIKRHTMFSDNIKTIFTTLLVWFLGYGLTWLSKWIIVDLCLGTNTVESAINQVIYRSIGDSYYVFSQLGTSLGILFNTCLITLIIFIIPTLLNSNIKISSKKITLIQEKELLIIAIIPILWSFLSFNHFILHMIFTYRNFIPIMILLLILIHKKLKYT